MRISHKGRASVALGLAAMILTLLGGIGFYRFRTYHNNPVVLEIYTDCHGLTYPRGKVLDFRLYRDGRVEYDDYPEQESFAVWHYHYWFPQTHRYINLEEVSQLLRLLEQSDFLSADAEYPASIPGLDSEFRTSISSNHGGISKHIVVVDFYGDDGVSSKARYPESLLLLLRKTNFLKRD